MVSFTAWSRGQRLPPMGRDRQVDPPSSAGRLQKPSPRCDPTEFGSRTRPGNPKPSSYGGAVAGVLGSDFTEAVTTVFLRHLTAAVWSCPA